LLKGERIMAKAVGTKNKQAAAIKESEVLDQVADLSLDGVSSSITATQVEVQKSLADLSAKITDQLQMLRKIEDAIELKRDELKSLYDMEAKAIDLDELTAQIEAQRKAWVDEQTQKKREFAENQSERNKQWARAEEEYQYKLAQEHRKQQDEFATLMTQKEKENRDRQEQLDKSWAEREGELKKRETEMAELREKVANMPETIKKEVNAAVAVATNSVKKEYDTKILLAAKDTETAQKLASQEVASLTQTTTKLHAQIEDLKAQLEQAHRDMKEISAKALESASGRSAMEALQKVLETEPGSYKQGK
jgi:colicin import membrane protein